MNPIVEKATLGTQEITLETGVIARQASGAVLVRCADTVVLVTAVAAKKPKADASFFPLTVEYRENAFASGRIPGGFFRREGRPTEKEILTSRVIDRPIRPLFPDGFLHDTQIMAQPLSADPTCDPDMLSITGASAALMISDIPWAGPIAGIRIIRVNGELLVNPPSSLIEAADLHLVLAASRDAIVMVEGEAREIPEETIIDALLFGHRALQPLLDAQERLAERVGKAKMAFSPPAYDKAVEERIQEAFGVSIRSAYQIQEKQIRNETLRKIRDDIQARFLAESGEAALASSKLKDIETAYEEISRKVVRGRILEEGIRIDGRDTTTIRPISIDVGWLPRVHGSALFTRGETQASATATLGTVEDEQRIETLLGSYQKRFLLHYNFPPYSTGETKPLRGPGRREIGHGYLAERSLEQVIPSKDAFPYTIRVVSDITESNGSSSMASVCGGSLALMDAGVPIRRPVAGVAMGLIKEGERFAILTDILGDEDHLGDMDFKVTGTREGICAIQMDIKIDGLSRDLLTQALHQARTGRLYILDKMDEVLPRPRPDLSPYAPRIVNVWVKAERIRDVIGPGGKVIRGIAEQTGAAVNIDDTGRVTIASPNAEACQRAIEMIKALTRDVEPGQIYLGTVKGIKDFGAFVEIVPGREGLLHISHIHGEHLERVTDILQEGDEVLVKVLEIDPQGRIRLSRKDALEEQAAQLARASASSPAPALEEPPAE